MARNPELDHEFKQDQTGKPQEPPEPPVVYFDTNDSSYCMAPKYTESDLLTSMSVHGENRTPLKLVWRILLGIGAFALGALLMLLVIYLFGMNSPYPV